ncbi:hypothetical protein WR25_09813 [Diploscapter pachys]|uniref:Uncharacterized protein n=1 Tax=Diploscapter pachys TaxID=2018661 RepID=A0A2A2LWK4_9BILA|nr:hypothetical protein WR25_09813 [Diploscapter pachys]
MSRFAGKVAIVTGASSGIGRATAVLMAKDGAKLTITGRNQQELEETAKQTGLPAENLNLVAGDITKHDVQQVLIDTTVSKFGKLDILVNNAGAGFTDKGKAGFENSIECYHKNIELNLTSVLEVIQKAKPHLIKSRGDIVNLSSIASSTHANVSNPYYSVAKAGLDQLSRNLALELIQHDVRVNTVNPGMIKTNFLERAYHMETDKANKAYDAMCVNPIVVPRKVAGTPEDIAKVIVFLADREASGIIIGQNLIADGGSALVMGITAAMSAK